MAKTRHNQLRPSFTLVELVVVILILGILAAVAAPRLLNSSDDATKNVFVTQLFIFVDGFSLYAIENGNFPPGGTDPGELPSGVEQYVSAKGFAKPSPYGGLWDYMGGPQGQNAILGVEFTGGVDYPGDAVFQQIDQEIDDGDTTTGSFVIVSGSSKWVYFKLLN